MQEAWRTILGLDFGTSSLGFALIRVPEDETQSEIIRIGVRKFNDVYTKGDNPDKKNTTANKERRDARLMRRQTKRKRDRRQRTISILRRCGLAARSQEPFPGLPATRFSPYDIWARAYDTDLTPYEFGRILYLLAHRRGFKSNLGAGLGNLKERPTIAAYLKQLEEEEVRKAEAEANKKKSPDADGDDDGRKTLVQVGNWHRSFYGVPLGTFFFAVLNPGLDQAALAALAKDTSAPERIKANSDRQQVRNKAANPLWARPDRAAYEEEFDRLWARRAPHLGLSEEVGRELRRVLFYQNPLEFPADNRAFCRLGKVIDQETGETRAAHRSPKCNLLFQEYRIRKLLADLKLKETEVAEFRHLTTKEKEILVSRLNEQGRVTWGVLAKVIGIPKAKFESQERKQQGHDYSKSDMVGNPIAGWFASRKDDEPAGDELRRLWEAPERFLVPRLKEAWKGTEKGRRESVRHHLIRIIGEAPFARVGPDGSVLPRASAERIVHILQHDFELSDLAAYRLAIAPFPSGFGNLSYEAMARLLPHLREGKMEWEAVRDEFDSHETGEGPAPLGYIPAPPSPQEVLSPRVRKSLNQARHLINALRKEIPDLEIDEIRIELARRMQMGNEDYKSLLAYQAYNQKMNDLARRDWDACRPGVRMPRGFDTKYRLWREQGGECPYTLSAQRKIEFSQLLDETAVEVEHIVPRQIGGDSYANKVLVFREANQRKGGSAPWELSEEWRLSVAANMRAWPVLNKKTDDTAAKQEDKGDRAVAPPKAVDLARSKIGRVMTSRPPAAREEGFAERQLVETGYIAKEAITYLQPAARKVSAVKSSFSTSLARNWGFYKRLNDLHADDLGKIPKGQKDRILNRHHAVDALATALCSPKIIHRIVALEKELTEMRDPRHALKAMDPDMFIPAEDAEVREKWLRKRLGELQPRAIANGLTGALAEVVVSQESRQRPRGKFFAEQPLGVSKKRVVVGERPAFLNRRVAVTGLKAAQVFPELGRKPKSGEEGEEGSTRGVIRSALTRQRIADYLVEKGYGPERGAAAIEEFLKRCTEGIPFRSQRGEGWIRKVLTSSPADKLANYRILEKDGGLLLYPKLERHCAVIVPNGKKTLMEVVPLVDAARGLDADPAEYLQLMISLAAERSGLPVSAFAGAGVFHKGDMIRIRRHGQPDWEPEIYRVEVIDGGGKRLWIRAHWSADRETLKEKAVGSVIASATSYEFLRVRVTPSGSFEG